MVPRVSGVCSAPVRVCTCDGEPGGARPVGRGAPFFTRREKAERTPDSAFAFSSRWRWSRISIAIAVLALRPLHPHWRSWQWQIHVKRSPVRVDGAWMHGGMYRPFFFFGGYGGRTKILYQPQITRSTGRRSRPMDHAELDLPHRKKNLDRCSLGYQTKKKRRQEHMELIIFSNT